MQMTVRMCVCVCVCVCVCLVKTYRQSQSPSLELEKRCRTRALSSSVRPQRMVKHDCYAVERGGLTTHPLLQHVEYSISPVPAGRVSPHSVYLISIANIKRKRTQNKEQNDIKNSDLKQIYFDHQFRNDIGVLR